MIRRKFGAAVAAAPSEDSQAPGANAPVARNSAWKKLALGVLVGTTLIAAAPAVSGASPVPATMTISSNVFPTGASVAGGLSGTVPVAGGSSVTLAAPEYVYQPSVPPGSMGTVYEFMFWDINSSLVNTATADFKAPSSGTTFSAGAWYLPVCVVSSSCGSGGPTSVTTWAFSLTNDKILPGTPISSVSPSSAWTSPSTSVSTATAVNIGALPFLGPHSKFGATEFRSWFVFGGGGATVSGLQVQVPAGESPYAIAFYNEYASHVPPIPCIGYPHCI
jgi:hypothetical protein